MFNYDVHLHKVPPGIKGGIVISIDDDERPVPGSINNHSLKKMKLGNGFLKAFHCHSNLDFDFTGEEVLYFHTKRNRLSWNFVNDRIVKLKPVYVLVDTYLGLSNDFDGLNTIISNNKNVRFLLCHGGGYAVNSAIQVARYNSNCFVDFSATIGNFSKQFDCYLRCALDHCFREKRLRHKILFGSDYPEFSPESQAVYLSQFFPSELIEENFWTRFLVS